MSKLDKMPVFVVLIVAIPFVFAAWLTHRILEHRVAVKRITAAAATAKALPPGVDVAQRLENLEAIVASLDYDLAERLRTSDGTRAA